LDREARLKDWLDEGGTFRRGLKTFLTDSIEAHFISAQLDVRPVFSALRQNKSVLVAGDGLKSAEFVQLPFLSGTYPFPKGFMKISMATGSEALPIFAVEGDGSRWINVKIGPALELIPNSSLEDNLLKWARVLEEQILQNPHLWYRWGILDALKSIKDHPHEETIDRWNRSWIQDMI
jgi:hypothetical protein